MELTPSPTQKSRVGTHPKLFAAIIRPDVLSHSRGLTYPSGIFARVLRNKCNCLKFDKNVTFLPITKRKLHPYHLKYLNFSTLKNHIFAKCYVRIHGDRIVKWFHISFRWNHFKSITAKPRLISVLRERRSVPHFTILMMASLLDRSAATLIK